MPKTKATRKKTTNRVRFAKIQKQRITRKLRSKRRHGQKIRDCSWKNLPMTPRRGGGSLKPAEVPNAYVEIRNVIPVVGNKEMYSPDTGNGSYYGYNTTPSLPDPVDSNNYFRKGMVGGSLFPRDLVDLGRNTMHSIQKFYGTLTTQPVPASPSVMEQPIGENTKVTMPENSIDLEKYLKVN